MSPYRLLLVLVAFGVSGCGSQEPAGVDGEPPTGSGSMGAGGASTGGGSTGGTSAGGGAFGTGGTAPSGGASSGGAPTVNEAGCEAVDELPAVTLPYDECQGQPDVTLPESASGCVLWTGLGYLHAVSDSRGVVVRSLDQDGAVVHEEILSAQPTSDLRTRLSKNGDQVLIVVDWGIEEAAAVAVLDPGGIPLSPLHLLAGEDYPQRFDFAVTPHADGWLVAFGYNDPSSGSRGILFSTVSQGGVVAKQHLLKVGGYVSLSGFAPGDSGEVLLQGTYDSGGQFSTQYEFVARVDLELDAVSCLELQLD